MMKRTILIIAALCALQTAGAQDWKSLLKSLFGSSDKKQTSEQTVVETSKYPSARELADTWTYSGSAIAYTGDDVLASMAVGALEGQIESYCTKAGIVAGRDKATFGRDGSAVVQIGEKKAEGTYDYDPNTGSITLKIAIGGKQGTLTGEATLEEGVLTILFDADQALTAMKAAAPELAQNDHVKMASNLVAKYPGVKIGAKAKK